MKINIVIPSTVLGGGVRVIFLYSNYLVSQGHDVVVYVPMLAYTNKRGIPNIKTSIANTFKRGTEVKWFDCKFKVKLAPAIKNMFIRDADITMASAWFTAPDVYDLNDKKGKKVYFIQDYEIWNQKTEVVDNTYRLDMNRIVITSHLKNLMKEKFNVESNLIYNGHSKEEYIYVDKKINKTKCIIMLCNTSNYKGGKEGLKLLERLKKKYDIRVVLFGTNKPKNLNNEFEFYQSPERSTLMKLYKEADILLFPSLQEAWGLPVIEAMANKCAVVGNNTGCLKELCKHEKDALIVENFDFKELEKQVERLLVDDELLRIIQNNGYNLAKSLSWEESFKKMEDYLEEIIVK